MEFSMPFLKWAGGKRWFVQSAFFAELPKFERYIEPFLGGGAVLFALSPARGIASDINDELIHLYKMMRDEPVALQTALERHAGAHSKEYYYKIRAASLKEPVERAARMLYLNRTCWNGLYRVNLSGEFNVPIGTKDMVIYENEDFMSLSNILAGIDLACKDFEEVLEDAGQGDLVFLDPPYTVAHNMNGFVKYNERMFRWDDQIRLRDAACRAAERGAAIVMTNADHPSVSELYKPVASYSTLERYSVISGSVRGRRLTTEALITMNI